LLSTHAQTKRARILSESVSLHKHLHEYAMYNKKLPAQHEVFTLPRTRSCGGLSEGTCTTCTKCGASEYLSEPCSDIKDAICTDCGLLRDCPAGTYRRGCGSGSTGTCEMCAPCAAGFYRVECGGFSEGRCACCAVVYTPTGVHIYIFVYIEMMHTYVVRTSSVYFPPTRLSTPRLYFMFRSCVYVLA
jgi:hypothetical protein